MKAKVISENAESKAQPISNVHAQPVVTCFHLSAAFTFPARENCPQDPVCLKFSTPQWSRISNLPMCFSELGRNFFFLEAVTQNNHEKFINEK